MNPIQWIIALSLLGGAFFGLGYMADRQSRQVLLTDRERECRRAVEAILEVEMYRNDEAWQKLGFVPDRTPAEQLQWDRLVAIGTAQCIIGRKL